MQAAGGHNANSWSVASPDDRRPLADYYFVLGVPPDATETELHAAWRRQLKYWHPDRGNHPDALEHAKLINLAHDVLTNSTKRAAYDRQRAAAAGGLPHVVPEAGGAWSFRSGFRAADCARRGGKPGAAIPLARGRIPEQIQHR